MKFTSLLFLAVLLISQILSCGKDKSHTDPEALLRELSEVKEINDAKKYYTSGTVEMIEKARDENLLSPGNMHLIIPAGGNDIEWEVVESMKNNEGNEKIILKIKYTKHNVENMIGYEKEYDFIKENGMLKIDMEKELKVLIGSTRKKAIDDYIDSITEKKQR